jgi:hypothetical protein
MRLPKTLAATMLFAALVLLIGSVFTVFTVDTLAQVKVEICDNKIDDDGDLLVDLDDPDCKKTPPPGTGCSPGFYKNHQEDWVGICCTDTTTPSCSTLLTALTCNGSDASCGRSAAAAFLDACTGCSE